MSVFSWQQFVDHSVVVAVPDVAAAHVRDVVVAQVAVVASVKGALAN